MVCKKCNSEWKTDGRISASLTACPFCGESLADETESKARLFDTSKDALLFIVKKHSSAVLLGKTLRSLFPDYAPQVSKNRKDLVNAVYDKGAALILQSNLNAPQATKETAFKQAVGKLTEGYISQEAAEDIIREFADALGWQLSAPAREKPAVTQPQPQQAAVQSPPAQFINTTAANDATKDFEYVLDEKGFAIITGYKGNATTLTVPDTLFGHAVVGIRNFAFYSCKSLISLKLPDGLTSIETSAFVNCKNLTSLSLPKELKSVGAYAFDGCESLTSLSLPKELKSIGAFAFNRCESLTSLYFPDSLVDIKSNPIGYAKIEVILSASHPRFMIQDGVLIDKVEGRLIYYPSGSMQSHYSIPDGIKSIGREAFCFCHNLTSLSLPDSLMDIGYNPFRLSNIKLMVSPTHPRFMIQDGVLIDKVEGRLIYYPYKSTQAYYSVPEGIKSIGYAAFSNCRSLTSVNLPNGLTSIGNSAFWECKSLTSVNLPNGLTSIGKDAFSYCANLILIVKRGSFAASWAERNFNQNAKGWNFRYHE